MGWNQLNHVTGGGAAVSPGSWAQYTVFFLADEPGLSDDKGDLVLTAASFSSSFISGFLDPFEFSLPDYQPSRSGGRYLSGAKRIIHLASPIIAGSIKLNPGTVADSEALRVAATYPEVWVCAGGLYARLATPPWPFVNDTGGLPDYEASAILTRDLMLKKRDDKPNILSGGVVISASFTATWGGGRRNQ